jgi:polysaccharide pyruvyl transferase
MTDLDESRGGTSPRNLHSPFDPWPRPSLPKRVALVYGGGGQNVGNAFFCEGGKWILEQVFGEGAIGLVQTPPAYWTFRDQRKGNPRNAFPLLANLDVDFLVLQGPLFTRTFKTIWRKTLLQLRERGGQLVLLGCAFHGYDREEADLAEGFLREVDPLAVVTRDTATYRSAAGWGLNCHNGVDSAFALPHAYHPPVIRIDGEYIAMTFDRYPEPSFFQGTARTPEGEPTAFNLERELRFDGEAWHFAQPKLQEWFSNQGKWQAYLGARLDRRLMSSSLGRFQVIRPEHRYNPHVSWKIYRQPNGIVSDEPFTYLAVYAGAALTLSDRVHACVATLAYEKPAMLFTPSRRSHLFERIGLADIRKRPVTLPAALRDELLSEEIDFLKKSLL